MKTKSGAVGRELSGPRPFIRRFGETRASVSTIAEIGVVLRRLRCAIGRTPAVDPAVLESLRALERLHERLRVHSAERCTTALADLYGGVLRLRALLSDDDHPVH